MINISTQPFGTLSDGRTVTKYTLVNDSGMQVGIIDYGCAVQSIIVPDKDGDLRDVALGYDDAQGYEKGSCYIGAFVGRYANRIGGARFSLNSKTYQLQKNDGENHLHGTFSHRLFEGIIRDNSVVFPFASLPSEEGYPGTLTGEVVYRLTDDNALEIEYTATADEDTVVNLTNHTYFNLNGQDGADILNHTLKMNADGFTELNENHIATGKIISVKDTSFDFREEKAIGADIFSDDIQLRLAGGYDHNMVLNGEKGALKRIATVKSRDSGIVLTALTTEAGVQLYTGNFVHEDSAPCGKGGIKYPRFGGFCLEAQGFPNAVNLPEFPDSTLKKGKTYHQKTVYRFSVEPTK